MDPDPDPYLWLTDPVLGGPKKKHTNTTDPNPQHCFLDSRKRQECPKRELTIRDKGPWRRRQHWRSPGPSACWPRGGRDSRPWRAGGRADRDGRWPAARGRASTAPAPAPGTAWRWCGSARRCRRSAPPAGKKGLSLRKISVSGSGSWIRNQIQIFYNPKLPVKKI